MLMGRRTSVNFVKRNGELHHDIDSKDNRGRIFRGRALGELGRWSMFDGR